MRSVPFALLLVLASFQSVALSATEAGEQIFKTKCESCHSVGAAPKDYVDLATTKGPSLRFSGSKYKAGFLTSWLTNPYVIRPAGFLPFRFAVPSSGGDQVDPHVLPVHLRLPGAEATEVAEFLMSLHQEPNQFPQAEPDPDLDASVHFTKILGCASCHQSAPGVGGVSGPQLTTMSARLDPEWFKEFVSDPVSWGPLPMPKISIRADQLATVTSFLEKMTNPAVSSGTSGASVVAPSRELPARRVEVIYQLFCSQCHGVTGNGKGINAPYLFVAPRNHTSFAEMSALTDDRIYAVIRYGGSSVGKSILMPSWGAVIKDDDLKLLVGYLRELSGTQQQGAANHPPGHKTGCGGTPCGG